MNRRRFCVLIPAALASFESIAAGAQPGPVRTFGARLSTVPIDLAMAGTIAGSGAVAAALKNRTLTVSGTFKGLKSAATIVQLHRSPNRGIRGPAFADLTATAAASGEISGSVELTAAQVEDLEKGRLYVQLHSEKAPDGNLWGWLLAK